MDATDLHTLIRKRNTISRALTLMTMAVYFGYVFMLAFSPDGAVANKLSSGATLGIPIGIGVIVFCWILTGIYVRWANTEYDELVRKVKEQHSRQ